MIRAGRRSGFTLLETMLVLALLVAMGALAWPALDKSFASQRLKKSADQLHADLTRARAAAMRTGTTRQFSLDANAAGAGLGAAISGPGAAATSTVSPGTRYVIGPMADGSALATAAPTSNGSQSLSSGGPESRTLPDGITLVRVEAFDDVVPPPYAPAPAAPAAANGGAVPASTTVYFHPDGSTSSARFTLANEQGLYLRVELRGLTGAVTKSDLLTTEQAP